MNLSQYVPNNKSRLTVHVILALLCLFLGMMTQYLRTLIDANVPVLIVYALNSLPSFFYVFGLLSICLLATKNTEKLSTNSTFLVAGALGYEVSQLFIEGTFDVLDLAAILLGACLFWFLFLRAKSLNRVS
ncbi:MAG: hypothetical protein GJ680_10585 [Alteromonadaceae bacterium]|nr:hypothetical protein [Alteromonadaceae bacterium]